MKKIVTESARMKVTKANLEEENYSLRSRVDSLRVEANSLREIPKLDQRTFQTMVVAFEKQVDCMAHVVTDLRILLERRT